MKLDNNPVSSNNNANIRVSKRNAYHQAGHVVAIHIGNQKRNLPAVYFQVAAQPISLDNGFTGRIRRIPDKYIAKLEGGRLLPDLSYSCFQSATRRLSASQRQQCLSAIEADVINLLAGSLAEAKYVAQRDGEVFNANLVYLGALKFYGGSTDMELVNEYMDCLSQDNKVDRQKKMAGLFLAAYSFVNDRSNWLTITQLAEAIHSKPKELFTCEDLIALLEQGVTDLNKGKANALYKDLRA